MPLILLTITAWFSFARSCWDLQIISYVWFRETWGSSVPAQLLGSALQQNKQSLTQRDFEKTFQTQSLCWQFKARLQQRKAIWVFFYGWMSREHQTFFSDGSDATWICPKIGTWRLDVDTQHWNGAAVTAFDVTRGFDNKNRAWCISVRTLHVECEHNLQPTEQIFQTNPLHSLCNTLPSAFFTCLSCNSPAKKEYSIPSNYTNFEFLE